MTAEARKLAQEMLDGLPGVTPGPWFVLGSHDECWVRDKGGNILQYGYDGEMRGQDAAHIARCSPENIALLCRAIIELSSTPDPLSQALNEGDGVYRP